MKGTLVVGFSMTNIVINKYKVMYHSLHRDSLLKTSNCTLLILEIDQTQVVFGLCVPQTLGRRLRPRRSVPALRAVQTEEDISAYLINSEEQRRKKINSWDEI